MTYFPEDSMKISPLTNKSLSLEIEGRTRKLSPSRPEQASDEGGSRLDTELVLHEGRLGCWMARRLLVVL